MVGDLASLVAALAIPAPLAALMAGADLARLTTWTAALRGAGAQRRSVPLGRAASLAGELAVGTPYEANTLEAYLRAGASASGTEPVTLSLTRFDCVTLVESCLAVARVARSPSAPTWKRFEREMVRMRYRNGLRGSYASRLHYFSEWIADGERRGLLRDLGRTLGGIVDARPLRFMTEHRSSYVALADEHVFQSIVAIERRLDDHPRTLIPTARIADVSDGIETGDVLAFATSIPGLDVSHAAFAYRDEKDTLRVLHAPLSGGTVEVSRATLPEYVAALRRSTGILVARPT